MRTALVRRTVLTASAVSLALLATACGSDKADTKTDAKPSAPASSAAPAAKGKTDAELTALLVTQAEVPDYVVNAEAAAKLGKVDSTQVTTDKPECKVLVQTQALQKIGTPTGVARTALSAKPKEAAANASPEEKLEAIQKALGATATMTGLSSFDGKGAEELVASFKAAGTACAGGFSATSEGETTKYESVKPGPAVTGGDEAASLALTVDLEDGDKGTLLLVVARKGSTVASFSSISLLGAAESPKTLIDTQVKKLG
ncbi:hypothetical protein J7E99_16070 [Streptomyces sp. ISL-44]|uniref:hypothetical protein n=1 Tax=Streptomyces sp. ISL-44 TaxID=2819184 RepID=UPI001BEC9C81|nr:hypothetical protein [Streptomyces sp. ISL-44]MBT2542186.1 hypothetical protein [Streptomyces sp. ISL-44]